MRRYVCSVKMAIEGFGFSVTCWLEADDMPAAVMQLMAKMQAAKRDRQELQFREVSILAPTIVGDVKDADQAGMVAQKGKDANND